MRREDILDLLFNTPWHELRLRAAHVLESEKGFHVHVRGLVEFSSNCRRNCLYCGLRADNHRLQRYTLSRERILEAAAEAAAAGADTIVLQSGEYAVKPEWLARVIADIRSRSDLPVTLSVGEQPAAAYALWKEAGAVRYLLKHETVDAKLYAALHPGHDLRQRIACLHTLASLGYECGSGFMVGLPGQRPESLADDILLARRLRVAMCGVGPFIPQAHTPLGKSAGGSAALTLRVMAVLRIALPWANIPATTALATVDAASGQRDGLLAGANVLMPGFTPSDVREDYCIYDNKNRVDLAAARQAIEGAGRRHALDMPHMATAPAPEAAARP
ncbi:MULTISPECIES: [FeFe] hydrogenase H-cluster radical SAM maturase HydE [Desulfovibrio]|uniref:Biotin synthase n=1 Tax=Desulfovibrio desulfuricans TaxID=876 RepID=A0AA94L272_DESDE|nr:MULTISPECIES: [FeFe] hydrogenase H-cluster radical SAM maturase HydE [Desulfovibrio]ATD81588.1 [FeFe] hydrogenase H-cluster radical SAM maturase HydE [Desulfovibrio sp. G11]SFW47098.1 biotin synthase [Desulfovibrio desulfuricans]SPD34309.1 [FeFe] hydrogenase maturation protein HydE [Desulfovibrio sp. G11]